MHTLTHFLKFMAGLDTPHSQLTANELQTLLNYARGKRQIVEIGCYEGKTSCTLAGVTDGVVYSIDPFHKGRLGICYSERIARTFARRNSLRNIRFVKGYSYAVADQIAPPVDLLFIDADHSYEGVKRDWLDYTPKVRPGGFIALHDSKVATNSPRYIGSMQFYDQEISQMSHVEEVASIDSLVVLRVK